MDCCRRDPIAHSARPGKARRRAPTPRARLVSAGAEAVPNSNVSKTVKGEKNNE